MTIGKSATRNPIRRPVWIVSILTLLSPFTAHAQRAETPKSILVLYWYGKDYPGNVEFDRCFQAHLQAAPIGPVEYYSEYLESNRFPGENQSRFLRDYLRQKYADHAIDVIVAVTDAPLEFLLKYRDDLLPRTPIVFVAVKRPSERDIVAEPGLTGIVQGGGYKSTIDLARKLQPDTKHVFIISGTLNHDKEYEKLCRDELRGYEDRVQISYLTDFPLDKLIFTVKGLPDRSIVFYIWQQSQNDQGKVLESTDILPVIAQATTAPIYGVAGWQVGKGIVGGFVRTVEGNCTRAAELALRIAYGERAQNIPIEHAPTVPMFDWRELKRRGISENLLPPGSVVQFRASSLWDLYRWQIMGIISLCLVEAFLILALLAQRARRGLAEKGLRESYNRIENLAGRLIVAQEEERKHIARELHDDLHQQVAALAIGLGSLGNQLAESDRAVQTQLINLEQGTTKLSEWVRTLSHELHSSVLEHAGLTEAVKLHCSGLREQQGIEVSLDLNCTEDLPANVALCLYRIVQESLRNVVKHSGVKRAELILAVHDGSVELRVEDQGIGFDLKDLRGEGLGLLSMEERIRLLGGKLEIGSEPGAGTKLRVCVPVNGRAPVQ